MMMEERTRVPEHHQCLNYNQLKTEAPLMKIRGAFIFTIYRLRLNGYLFSIKSIIAGIILFIADYSTFSAST